MLSQDYDAFMQRMKQFKKHPLPKELLECIDKRSLMKIVDDVLTNPGRQKRYRGLKPNKAIRYSKEFTDFTRTFCVLRAPNGEYQCILETKSKNAQNKKRKIKVAKGGSKIGKPAWRLDGKNGAESYYSLKVRLSKKSNASITDKKVIEELEALEKEVQFPWQYGKESRLVRNVMGAVYQRENELVASVYSKKGSTLFETNKSQLSSREREQIASDLLKSVAFLHSEEQIFQDIKCSNILLFRKKDGGIKAKLTDPGQVASIHSSDECVATIDYESPEIALAHAGKTSYSNYFKKTYLKDGPTLGKKQANVLLKKLQKTLSRKKVSELKKEYLVPHQANDMWAIGVTLYKLFHKDQLPKTIPTTKRFAGFFAPRDKRITADDAVKLWTKKKI
ncbi:protein kinase domain-containing protein [Candidatus Berkiella aquae]|uniref:Protein kinase n=1 Tax=Candidatus Berkiella aquae TaxID=295108 RepID=A0A0Q9YS56_9GAMM|nr:protein kinase [Candidatus Berkiella aquae]MCS5710841.1 protein kinase [Candidatus Berkiella aquae]